MKTFIRAIESWVPSNDRSILEFGGGLYGSATRFAAVSRDLCFGRGEGLPGQAWEAGHPIVLKQFEGSYFRRTAAAKADGLTCGIAVPIFAGEFLLAVMVIFCGDDEVHAGAIELWHNDPNESHDMALVDGYYGSTGDTFEFISRSTSFRRGNGLPGLAWEAQAPVFMEDLGKASGFLRADGAVKVGINRGFALPCSSSGDSHYVMAFLSALATPIAQRIEIWRPDAGNTVLLRSAGFCETEGTLGADTEGTQGIARGEGAIGQTYLTGVPSVMEASDRQPDAPGNVGTGGMVAIPVVLQSRLAAVMALYF